MGATWKRICACLVFVIAALCLPAAAFADTATVSLQGNYRQADARSMLQLVNDFRAESDLWVWDQTNSTKLPVDSRPAYIYDYGLEQAAKLRAREIALCYSHTRPDGSDPWTAYPTGIFYGGRSENIAAGQRDVAAAFNAWREDNDPYAKQGHRRAMLGVGFNSDGSLSYRNYAYIGIACFEYDGRKYWVQEISINPTNIADPGINDEPGFFDVTTDTAPFERGSISIDASSLEVDHQTPVDLPKITAELFVGSDWSWGGYHYPRKAALPVKPTSVYIEDTSVAAIEDGKIVPKMGGATRLIATLDVPGGETLRATCSISVTGFPEMPGTFTVAGGSVYTGAEVRPAPSLVVDGKALVLGTDYKVNYANNLNAGTATAYAVGLGAYAGRVSSVDFEIAPYDISGSRVRAVVATSATYNGLATHPEMTVADGSATLIEGTDFTLSNDGDVNVGSEVFTVAGIGNYTGTCEFEVNVTPKDIASDDIEVPAIHSQFYTGSPIRPGVRAIDHGRDLSLTNYTDFTLAFSNNTAQGTATVTLTGIGNYAGTRTATFDISTTFVVGSSVIDVVGTYHQSDARELLDRINELRRPENAWEWNDDNTEKVWHTDLEPMVWDYGLESSAKQLTAENAVHAYGVWVRPDGSNYQTTFGSLSIPHSAGYDWGSSKTLDNMWKAWAGDEAQYSGQSKRRSLLTSGYKYFAASCFECDGIRYWLWYFATEPTDAADPGANDSKVAVVVPILDSNVESGTLTVDENPVRLPRDGQADLPDITARITPANNWAVRGFVPSQPSNLWIEDPSIAGIENGRIVGKKTGTTTLTVRLDVPGHEPILASCPIEVAGKDIAKCTAKPGSGMYMSKSIDPDFEVYDGTKRLVKGTDYTVTPAKTVYGLGTYDCTLTGIGDYAGTLETQFTVVPRTLDVTGTDDDSLWTFNAPSAQTYTGKALEPSGASVRFSPAGYLSKGTDYELEWSDNTNVGTAKVTFKGIGKYTGSRTVEFAINPKSISAASVSVASISQQTIVDAPATPEVVITDTRRDATLVAGTDYTLEYANNTAAGSGKVTITGIGNYTNSVTTYFAIKQSVEVCTVTPPAGLVYPATATESDIKVALGSTTLKRGTDYTVAFDRTPNAAGTYTATITGMGKYAGEKSVEFTIAPKPLDDASVEMAAIGPQGYEGKPAQPAVVITDTARNAELVASTDFTASYEDNEGVGTGKVTVTGIGNYAGTLSGTFDIKDSIANCDVSKPKGLVYPKTIPVSYVVVYTNHGTLVQGQDYDIRYDRELGDAGTYTIIVTGKGWYAGEKRVDFEIAPKSIEGVSVDEIDAIEYAGAPVEPKPQVIDTELDRVLAEGTDYVLSYANNNAPGEATVTITGRGNYTGTLSRTFTIDAPPQPTIRRIAGDYANETSAKISAEAFDKSDWVVIARDDDFADALGATGLAGVLDAPIVLTDRFELSPAAAAEINRLGATHAYIIGGTGAIKTQVDDGLKALGVAVEPRIWGDASYDTSLACARKIVELGGDPDQAIIAMSTNFQDALSMSSYAYKFKVPVVLQTWGTYASDRGFTADAQQWLRGKKLIVAGGAGAISDASVKPYTVTVRLWGDTGYDTSQAIAEWMVGRGYLEPRTVVLACGAQAPKGTDALAGAALAGRLSAPVLLVNTNEAMEAANTTTVDGFLSANREKVRTAYVLGGAYVMPQALYDRIASIIGA